MNVGSASLEGDAAMWGSWPRHPLDEEMPPAGAVEGYGTKADARSPIREGMADRTVGEYRSRAHFDFLRRQRGGDTACDPGYGRSGRSALTIGGRDTGRDCCER